MRIESRPAPGPFDDDPLATPSPPPPAPRLAQLGDAHAHAVIAFALANTQPAQPARDATQVRLDAFRDATSGPYHAEGQTVRAPAQFRMKGGFNDAKSEQHRTTKDASENVFSILARAKLPPWLAAASAGRGTPSDLVKLTQALIDAGKLPPGSPATLADRIRKMQWEWGVGFDCAGYAQQALFAAHPGATADTLHLRERVNEDLSSLGANRAFAKVAPEAARPGDVVTLENPTDVGHIAIVHASAAIDAARADALSQKMGPACKAFLAGGGPFRELAVDSSWSAGADGDWCGGVRQETWLYDQSSKRWACWRPEHGVPGSWRLEITSGPCGETLQGFYRPKT